MTDTQALATQLCDHFMTDAQHGNIEEVGKNLTIILEYAAYELARAGNSDLSVPVFAAAEVIERRFQIALSRQSASNGLVVPFKPTEQP